MEITIFDVPDIEISTTKTQREIEYDQIKKISKIEPIYFDHFNYMEDETQERIKNNILSMMCVEILKYYIPIISQNLSKKEFSIPIQYERSLVCLDKDKHIFVNKAQKELINIIGFIIHNNPVKYFDKHTFNYYEYMSSNQLVENCKISLNDSITKKYTQQRESFSKISTNKKLSKLIIFSNDDNARNNINDILSFIDYCSNFYSTGHPLVLTDIKFPPLYYPHKQNVHPDITLNFNNSDLTKNVNNLKLIVNGEIDALYKLERYQLFFKYNIFTINGEPIKMDNIVNKTILLTERKYVIAQKEHLARKLFNKELTELDNKQIKRVNEEYDKMETTTISEEEKLFNQLRQRILNYDILGIKKTLIDIDKTKWQSKIGTCAHTYDHAKFLCEYDDIVDVRRKLLSTYGTESNNIFYCKICDEYLANDLQKELSFETTQGINSTITDELYNNIWKEAYYIVSNFVKFSMEISIKQFVNSLAGGLKHKLLEEEIKIIKNRTNVKTNSKDMINLYITVYVFGTLAAIMIENLNKIIFGRESDKGKRIEYDSDGNEIDNKNSKIGSGYNTMPAVVFGGKDADGHKNRKIFAAKKKVQQYVDGQVITTDIKEYEKFLLNSSYKLILLTKNSVIVRLPNIDNEFIKNMLLNCYLWAKQFTSPIKILHSEVTIVNNNFDHIENNPFYQYMKTAYVIAGQKFPIMNIKKGVYPLDIPMPDMKNYKIKKTSYGTLLDRKINDMYYEIYRRSLEQIHEYNTGKIFSNLFVPKNAIVAEYERRYEDIVPLQMALKTEVQRRSIKSIYKIKNIKNSISKYNDYAKYTNISMFYCPNGEKHKINSYVFSSPSGDVEYDKSELKNIYNNMDIEKIKQINESKITDEICEKCKNRTRSNTDESPDSESMANVFKIINNIIAFYQYFESRCPVSELHDIQNNKCTKCGFDTSFKKSSSKEYYNKYKMTYSNIEKRKFESYIKYARFISNRDIIKKNHIEETKPKFTSSLENLAKWSVISGVKYNLLTNIGLMEGHKYSDIDQGKINPISKINDEDDQVHYQRSIRIKGYILYVLRTYNMIIKYDNMFDVQNDLKDLIKQSGMDKNHNKLKPISENSNFVKVNAEYQSLKPFEYANFLIEYLSGLFIKMTNDNPNYSEFIKKFVVFLTNKILNDEKLTSKASIVFVDKRTVNDEATNENSDDESSPDNLSNQSEESESELDIEKIEDEQNTPFNNDDYDVENPDDIWDND